MPFIQIMNTWTRQKGYPVLTLDRNGSTYTVTQERFLTDPEVQCRVDKRRLLNFDLE